MAKRITDLTLVTSLDGTESVPLSQAGVTKRTTGSLLVLNKGDAPSIQAGPLAARPAAADAPNRIYIVTDSTPPNAMYRSDGTNWGRLDAVPDISVKLTRSAAQSIAHATTTTVTWDTETFDTDTMHDNVTNPSRITFTTAGKYLVGFYARWASNSTSFRFIDIQLNGLTDLVRDRRTAQLESEAEITVSGNFAAGDYVEALVHQGSGGPLDLNATSAFWAVRVA